jgi:SAM-dependent methyltransferase
LLPPVDWDQFREAAEVKPLNPFFATLEPFLPASGHALDLGCGTGRGTVWLNEHGFTVDAVDNDETSLRICRERTRYLDGVRVFDQAFDQFRFGEYDVVLALFSVFFVPPPVFAVVWPTLTASIKDRGLFAGQLIGPNDDWADEATTSHTREQIDRLFAGFEFEVIDEIERDGRAVWGDPKHWHVFHIVARKLE